MMLLDLLNGTKLRRAARYLLYLAGALWLQFSVLARLELLGTRLFFLPAAVVAIGMWEGGVWGGVLGLLAGFCCDLAMAESTVTFLILFAVYGFAGGVLAEFFCQPPPAVLPDPLRPGAAADGAGAGPAPLGLPRGRPGRAAALRAATDPVERTVRGSGVLSLSGDRRREN